MYSFVFLNVLPTQILGFLCGSTKIIVVASVAPASIRSFLVKFYLFDCFALLTFRLLPGTDQLVAIFLYDGFYIKYSKVFHSWTLHTQPGLHSSQ